MIQKTGDTKTDWAYINEGGDCRDSVDLHSVLRKSKKPITRNRPSTLYLGSRESLNERKDNMSPAEIISPEFRQRLN
jgi:hypothetical protein